MGDSSSLPRGTVTFLFTDIERSTEHARRLGADFARLRATHHAAVRAAIAEYGGHEVDTAGDGFFVAFERAADAVAAAAAAQRALHEAETTDEPLRVRMGIHTAEPFVDDGAYLGVGVHRAARICAAGHGGQILLSNATAGIVEDIVVAGMAFLDLGEHRCAPRAWRRRRRGRRRGVPGSRDRRGEGGERGGGRSRRRHRHGALRAPARRDSRCRPTARRAPERAVVRCISRPCR